MQNILIVNRAIIIKDNKCLVVKRGENDPSFPAHWELPGGKLENGHTLEENLRKEICEELSIEIDIIKENHLVNEDHVTSGKYKDHLIIELISIAKPTSNKIKLSEDHSEFGWFDTDQIEDLKTTDYFDATKQHLQEIIANYQ